MTDTTLTEEGKIAHSKLYMAIRTLEDKYHELPPCITNEENLWISKDKTNRNLAKRICYYTCPLLEICREAGQHEISGVWGGEDMGGNRRESAA